jgi:carboxypeptidase C (cathepsin A)
MTDLVFIDPVSTGYSRVVSDEDSKKFHGVDEDIKSVAEFIRLYVTRNKRWGSPKFLAGESYGTTRAAGLAGHLHEEHRMYLNGVILVSSILNYQTIRDDQGGNDLPYLLSLPTYSSTAWYHKKLGPDLQEKSLKAVLAEAEDFVINEYSIALLRGENLTDQEKKEMAGKLAHYTGLKPEYIQRSDLRVDVCRYCKELLKDEDRTVGRFDGRRKGIESNLCGESIENDPSLDAIIGGFTAAFNQYVREDLKWEKDVPYKVLSREVWPWDFGAAKNAYLNVSGALREAMTRNPRLKVFVASGYYDLATPYFATDYTFGHLGLDRTLLEHVTMEYYDAGHMMYTDLPSLRKMKEDLSKFIKKTISEKNS